MARRIAEGGYETTMWPADRQPRAVPDTAAKTAGSPAELAAASDLVCLCVVSNNDVREVVYGETACWPDWRQVGSSPSTAPFIPTRAARSPRRLRHRVSR